MDNEIKTIPVEILNFSGGKIITIDNTRVVGGKHYGFSGVEYSTNVDAKELRYIIKVCTEAINKIEKEEITASEHAYHKGFEAGVESVMLPKTYVAEKPILKSMDGFDTEVASQLVCPNCNKPIVNVWNTDKYKPNYCHYCGQKFDWSEENKDNSEQKSTLSAGNS